MEAEVKTDSYEIAKRMAELSCQVARACNEKENYFASMFNLTPAEFKCLRLFKNSNFMSIKEIAHQMKITPGRITHILTALEDKKFVQRKLDQSDKRNVNVFLTSKAEPFIKNLNESHIKLHQDILSKVEEDKWIPIIDAMDEVVKALRTWAKEHY